jgi:hypothetical protein
MAVPANKTAPMTKSRATSRCGTEDKSTFVLIQVFLCAPGILEKTGHSPMKALVAKLNAAALSAQTVNAYFRIAKAIVESAEDVEGNPLYERKWDAEKLDLPLVETSKQRRPSITAEIMAEFAKVKSPKCRMVSILADLQDAASEKFSALKSKTCLMTSRLFASFSKPRAHV